MSSTSKFLILIITGFSLMSVESKSSDKKTRIQKYLANSFALATRRTTVSSSCSISLTLADDENGVRSRHAGSSWGAACSKYWMCWCLGRWRQLLRRCLDRRSCTDRRMYKLSSARLACTRCALARCAHVSVLVKFTSVTNRTSTRREASTCRVIYMCTAARQLFL